MPPALAEEGRVVLLQPRRAAARAIAARIASERGWTIGREIGWQIRFDRRFSRDTRLLVATEGVLTARLQQDPLLSDFHTVIIDEFHERSIHADVALALTKQAWRARDDLRLLVMSATLDAGAVAAFLDHCPVIDVPGRMFPVDVRHQPGGSVAEAAAATLDLTDGGVLCFLPGAAEIRRTVGDLERRVAGRPVDVVPLYGALEAADQDRALRPAARRRIVVATNVAETSVTVPGVTAVVDSGLHKVARYDADRGIDSLDLERITADAAEQRAGRAGRESSGIVVRLWDARDRLRPRREPEIHRVDLAGPALEVIAWGGDPRRLDWFESPREEALDAALGLLERLGAVRGGSLTPLGDRLRRVPLHPRLARLLLAAGREGPRVCAILSERHFFPARAQSTSCDLLSALDAWEEAPPHVQMVAAHIEETARRTRRPPDSSSRTSADVRDDETTLRRALLEAYPDRVAQRREPGSPRVRLASGTGAVLAAESGVRDGEFLVAVDVQSARPGGAGAQPQALEARIRVASRVEREWLPSTAAELVHWFDEGSGTVKARLVERYDALVLSERITGPDPGQVARLLASAWLERGPDRDDLHLLRRLRFAGQAVELSALVDAAASGARRLDDIRLRRVIPPDRLRALERDAPDAIQVPSGRTVRLEYGEDGTVSASVKLQELFGLAETPRVGTRCEPVLLALLAPNGRPVQLTRDLRSFWERTYPEVRKELRGRYPKHAWPEDPWSAPPTARVRRRR